MNRPLRFCMITTFYPPYSFGGDGAYVRWLSHELAQRGHQVEVIHCIDSYRLLAGGRPGGPVAGPDHPNVTVHGLRSRFGPLSPLATQQTGFPLFKAARIQEILDRGFDVVHYHNVSLVGGPGILTMPAAGVGKASPVRLYTLHEYWLVCPTHLLFRVDGRACPGAGPGLRARLGCLACTLAYRRPPQWWRYTGLLRAAVRQVDTFIAPSRFCLDKHRALGLSAPIVHLPNSIQARPPAGEPDLPPDRAEAADPSGDEPYFLFVGRLERIKGLQTLIPLFADPRTGLGAPRASLWVAGAGSYEPHLRRQAGGSVRFLGYQSGERLQTLVRRAVAVIVPSLVWEIFPLVMLEAFREKTPVIVPNRGGMPEVVQESGGGFVYDTEDELVAAMNRLLSDSRLRDQLGERGYQAFRQKWTAEVHLERYLELVEGLMAGR